MQKSCIKIDVNRIPIGLAQFKLGMTERVKKLSDADKIMFIVPIPEFSLDIDEVNTRLKQGNSKINLVESFYHQLTKK